MENHVITIDNREKITVTEVADIDNFDEEEICANLKTGGLLIKGKGLHIQMLDLGEGKAVITGEINSLAYTQKKDKSEKGLIRKILNEYRIDRPDKRGRPVLGHAGSWDCLHAFLSVMFFSLQAD